MELKVVLLVVAIAVQTALGDLDLMDFDDCDKTMACFRSPKGCSAAKGECNFAATFRPYSADKQYVLMEALAPMHEDGDLTVQYLAVGFSADKMMPKTAISICQYDWKMNEPKFKMGHTASGGHSVSLMDDDNMVSASANMTEAGMSADGKYMICRFLQTIKPMEGMGGSAMPLDQGHFILMTTGFVDGSRISMHVRDPAERTYPVVSDCQINPATMSEVGCGELTQAEVLVKLHGIFMMVGWLILLSSGIGFARYFKAEFGDNKWFGLKIWFQMHRGMNITGLVFVIAALVCIFVAKGFILSDSTEPKMSIAHFFVGLIACLLGFLQPFVALLRCHPGTAKRPIFNWVHRSIGVLAWSLAVANVGLATKVNGAFNVNLGSLPLVVFFVYLGLTLIHVVCFEVHTYLQSAIDRRTPHVFSTTEKVPKQVPRMMKLVILGSYFLLTCICVVVLIVMLFS